MTAKAKKLQLHPAPIMWTLGDKWLPETTERDGLRFKLRHDYYNHRATEVLVYRASDDLHIESIRVDNHMEAENVVRAWSLEDWQAREEERALKKVERALADHREAMTRLNFVRGVRVEDVA